MPRTEQQIVGRFFFDGATQRRAGRRPQAITAPQSGDAAAIAAWFLAIAVLTTALWWLGL